MVCSSRITGYGRTRVSKVECHLRAVDLRPQADLPRGGHQWHHQGRGSEGPATCTSTTSTTTRYNCTRGMHMHTLGTRYQRYEYLAAEETPAGGTSWVHLTLLRFSLPESKIRFHFEALNPQLRPHLSHEVRQYAHMLIRVRGTRVQEY